jgi:predicted nucleic acid-binding protein
VSAPSVGAHTRGILDTGAFLSFSRIPASVALPEELLLTTVSLAELTVGPLVATGDIERAERQAQLQQAEAGFDPLPFDRPAAHAFGRVAASLRKAGRKVEARSFDAMIAAIALANELPLYTCNPGDFSGIDGLTVVAVRVD